MRVSVGAGPVRFGGPVALLVWLTVRALMVVGVVLFVSVCRPRRTLAALSWAGGLWLLLEHTVAVLVVAVLVVHGLEAWAHADPASWRRRGRPVLLGWARRVLVYRRSWRAAMHAAELGREDVDGVLRLPMLGRVRSLERVDVVEVRGLLGQRFAMWEEAAPMLAHTFGASDVRVHRGDDRRLTLELVRARRGRAWNSDGRLELEAAAS